MFQGQSLEHVCFRRLRSSVRARLHRPRRSQRRSRASRRAGLRAVDVDRSTIWPYKDGEPGEFIYQRYGHPAGVEAERRLGELDGGHALLFASGSGATTALVLTFLSSGETIALAQGAYFGTGVIFRELERWGLRVVEFDQTGAPPEGVDLVW